MMMSELERLIDTVTKEKAIPRDVVVEILENAVEAAARKKYGMHLEIEAQYNDELGEVELFHYVRVVEDPEDPDHEEEVESLISLEEARDLDEDCEVGDDLGIKMEAAEEAPRHAPKGRKSRKKAEEEKQETGLGRLLGRIAAQTAKQVIIQRVRDAERELTFNEFKDRKGELITGIVRRFEKGNIIVDLNRAEAILPRREQVQTETYRQGDRIQAYVLDITRATRQPQVVLSRTHPGLLMKLFEMEVPEIYEGIVRIEACAREPGFRAKIAVSSTDTDVDPVGACVGLKGSRVQAVVGELRGEAIDIIPWHPDPARFIQYAIAPASVSRVYIDESSHTMELVVPDDQLAKAIGRRGQNVRLAAQLTGWRIDIFSETKHNALLDNARSEIERIEVLDAAQIDVLVRAGFQSAQELADSDAAEVSAILEVDEAVAQAVVDGADTVVEILIMEESKRRTSSEADEEPKPSTSAENDETAQEPKPSTSEDDDQGGEESSAPTTVEEDATSDEGDSGAEASV